MKITTIDMDWTDTGARVLSSLTVACPRCLTTVAPNVEHLCGDRAAKPSKSKKKAAVSELALHCGPTREKVETKTQAGVSLT